MSDSTMNKASEAPVSPRPRSNSQGELESELKRVPAPLRHTKSWNQNHNGEEPLISARGPMKCEYRLVTTTWNKDEFNPEEESRMLEQQFHRISHRISNTFVVGTLCRQLFVH